MNQSQVGSRDSFTLFESVTAENPKRAPERITIEEYRSIPESGRDQVNKDYLDKKWKVELHNRDCFLWLWEVYKTETDLQRKHALEVKMSQFRKAIINTQKSYPALMLDFKKYTFSDKTETVDWSE